MAPSPTRGKGTTGLLLTCQHSLSPATSSVTGQKHGRTHQRWRKQPSPQSSPARGPPAPHTPRLSDRSSLTRSPVCGVLHNRCGTPSSAFLPPLLPGTRPRGASRFACYLFLIVLPVNLLPSPANTACQPLCSLPCISVPRGLPLLWLGNQGLCIIHQQKLVQ